MHAEVNHPGAPSHARRKRVPDLSEWVLDAALLVWVLSIAAVAVAWGVLLLVI
jgi:hypothetical protein